MGRTWKTCGFPILFSLISVLFLLVTNSATASLPPDSQPIQLQPGQKVFPYFNPVYPADAPDPAVLKVGNYIYSAVTNQAIYRSSDMSSWVPVGQIFANGLPAWVDKASPDIWAPDMNYINGQYVLYFSARAGGYSTIHRGFGVAWSDKPEGPYEAAAQPLVVGPGFANIDPMAFQDDDGKRYLYWGSDSKPIMVQELAADGLSFVGERKIALWPDPYTRYARLMEGSWVIKRGDYYYFFWSGDGYHPGNYAVSVARSTSPLGPFERYAANPILRESRVWTSPGHNAIIQDDAGQDWIFYHAYDTSDINLGRMLLIDKLVWADGWPRVANKIPSSQPVTDGPVWNTTAIPLVEMAYNKQTTASSEQPGKAAVTAVDGNTNTGWLPREDDAAPWLVVDLGEIRRIARVELRFRGTNHAYRLASSVDAVEWHLMVDPARLMPTYPFIERAEATARYLRISGITPLASGDSSLYDLRVYCYQNVWITSPATIDAVTNQTPIAVHVDNLLQLKSVLVTLDGVSIYEGTEPPTGALAQSLAVPDGKHVLTLRVVDCNNTIWQHDSTFLVKNAQVSIPAIKDKVQGVVPVTLRTGYAPESLRQVTVSVVPVSYGELLWQNAQVIYQGGQMPANLYFDTTAMPDGTYQVSLNLKNNNGNESDDQQVVMVRNWQQLSDEFEPPIENGWFGTLEKKKTVSESVGWDYDTLSPDNYWLDASRRVWLGDGSGELLWEMPGVQQAVATVFTYGGELLNLRIGVSADSVTWVDVPYTITEREQNTAGWVKTTIKAQAKAVGAQYLRLTMSGKPDQIQLGGIVLLAPAN